MTKSTRVNENITVGHGNGAVQLSCSYCGEKLSGTPEDYLTKLPFYEGPLTEAGPQVFADSSVFVDAPVVFRQYYCPGCYVAFLTEIVPLEDLSR